MKQFKKPLKLWLGRTMGDGFCNYQIGTRKKEFSPEDGFTDSFITSFCGAEFERVTGARLELGEVVKVRIEVDLIKASV